jgi:thiol-disulfide isomerase/thioredoxin
MKRHYLLMILLFVPSILMAAPRMTIYYFYDGLCELCDHTSAFYKAWRENVTAADKSKYPCDLRVIDAYLASGRQTYTEVTDSLGIDRKTLSLPVLIADGKVYTGDEAIAKNLREAFLTTGEDFYVYKKPYSPATQKTGARLFDDYPVKKGDVTIVYFYRTTCPDCAKVTPFMNALPASVEVDGIAKKLDVIRLNTRSGNNGERINAFFSAYHVPDADRMVPIVFLAAGYLAGPENIRANLGKRLAEDTGEWTLLPVKKE